MTDLTRRNAVRLLAGGSVLASGTLLGGGAFAAPPVPGSSASSGNAPDLPATARTAKTTPPPAVPGTLLQAHVGRCRSWDSSVYLSAGRARGFAQLSPAAFAIAAACQAAGRPVAMKFTEYEPDWNGGAGRFHGVVLAIDPQDLTSNPTQESEGGPWASLS
ncbi:MAG: hypothetical protein JNJ88_19525 [Planctomycetes bacterium]|nr:hypothetical protein [Planctomycetota bacterium]